MNGYTSTQVEKLINKYIAKNGTHTVIEEGCLGWGILVCEGEGLKTAIIKEFYVNAWSSLHTVRFYNKTPKVWEKRVLKANN